MQFLHAESRHNALASAKYAFSEDPGAARALSQFQSDVMDVLSPLANEDVCYPCLEGRAMISFDFSEGAISPLDGMSSQPGYEEANLQDWFRSSGGQSTDQMCASEWYIMSCFDTFSCVLVSRAGQFLRQHKTVWRWHPALRFTPREIRALLVVEIKTAQ